MQPASEDTIFVRVLDHGFVELLDFMGDDRRCVAAARVSLRRESLSLADMTEEQIAKDQGLLNRLIRDKHTSPFEHAVFQFRIRAPIFVVRQWMRHRFACLSGDTELYFDLPSAVARGRYRKHIIRLEDFHRRWHEGSRHATTKKKPLYLGNVDPEKLYTIPELATLVDRREEDLRNLVRSGVLTATRRPPDSPVSPSIFVPGNAWHEYAQTRFEVTVPMRDRLSQMHLRMCDEETGEIRHTRVTDVRQTGLRPVFRVTLENGYSIKMTKDHRCLTEAGWMTLGEATGLRITRRGNVAWRDDTPAFAVNGERRVLKRYTLSEEGLASIRAARSGENSNFWKGGVTSERANIARWTREQGARVHERNGYKCVLCGSDGELHAHHIDPVWHNPEAAKDLNNLTSLCAGCHRRLHALDLEIEFLRCHERGTLEGFWEMHRHSAPRHPDKRLPFPRGLIRAYSQIKSIEYLGTEMTYDIEVAGPYHNFIANGFVVHNSYNEESGRYVKLVDEFYVPDHLRIRVGKAMDYHYEPIDEERNAYFRKRISELCDEARALYEEMLEAGIAREHARIVLPVAQYTTFFWTVNALSLMNFCNLRNSEHAQWEIRQYASVIEDIFAQKMPWTQAAFRKHWGPSAIN